MKYIMNENNLIYLFHHIHHQSGEHKVHHCGGQHKGVNYKIEHCVCGLNRINKKIAIGHGTDQEEINVEFSEQRPSCRGYC